MESLMMDPMTVQKHRIIKIRKESHDTFSIDLVREDGEATFPFQPGQFNMLYIYGVGEIPISISSDPKNTDSLTHTIRAVGTVTRVMKKLKKGDVVGLRGPFGSHWPVHQGMGQNIVIIAGGIALAPLRPAIYEIIANPKLFGQVSLLYGTRTPDDILFAKELEHWHHRKKLQVHMTVDRATDQWNGNVGVVTKLINHAPIDPGNTMALVCGPEIMMRYCIYDLLNRGVLEDKIFISMERNMKCGVGLCGHCQCGNVFICKDGPVFAYPKVKKLLALREV
ncbi:MAG: FAD/NAD(P)-binding protein [Chlamydiota bacterium]|nr:FAD/NAD(P)-binding protein [Chlamydiota bacterium]